MAIPCPGTHEHVTTEGSKLVEFSSRYPPGMANVFHRFFAKPLHKPSDEYIKTKVTKRSVAIRDNDSSSSELPRALNAAKRNRVSPKSDLLLSHAPDKNQVVMDNVYTGPGNPTGTPDVSPPGHDPTIKPSGKSIKSMSDHCDEDVYICSECDDVHHDGICINACVHDDESVAICVEHCRRQR